MSHPLHNPTIGTVLEAQTLRQELADTRKKLQDYADTSMLLTHEVISGNHALNLEINSCISSW